MCFGWLPAPLQRVGRRAGGVVARKSPVQWDAPHASRTTRCTSQRVARLRFPLWATKFNTRSLRERGSELLPNVSTYEIISQATLDQASQLASDLPQARCRAGRRPDRLFVEAPASVAGVERASHPGTDWRWRWHWALGTGRGSGVGGSRLWIRHCEGQDVAQVPSRVVSVGGCLSRQGLAG